MAKKAKATSDSSAKSRRGDSDDETTSKGPSIQRTLDYYQDVVDQIDYEEDMEVSYETMKAPRISGGSLVFDLITNGGIPACWAQMAGEEGSGKTTNALKTLRESLRTPMLFRDFVDAENALNLNFAMDVMDIPGKASSIFGEQDRDDPRKWVNGTRQIHHSVSNELENVFTAIHRKLNRLPTKVYRDGKWFYVFDASDAEQKRMRELGYPVYKPLSTRKASYCELPDEMAGPQSITVIDSLPALVPISIAEDEKPGAGMAYRARLFSDYIPRISGLLRRKASLVIVINHIGLKPGEKYNPEYEKGGNAPKMFSSLRIWNYDRFVPSKGGFEKHPNNGRLGREESVEGNGSDTYKYKELRNVKSKWGIPFLRGYQRMWISDYTGNVRGICPVYDAYQYLKMTDQIAGPINGFTVRLVDERPTDKIKWLEFKRLILAELESKKYFNEVWADLEMTGPPLPVYKLCAAQNKRQESQKYVVAPKEGDETIAGTAEEQEASA